MSMPAPSPDRRLCIAPMMTHTDRHFRYLLRLISRRVMLYTEMVTTGALIHGGQRQRLEYNESEHPLGLQLGGAVPRELAEAARLAEDHGYDEVNLNIGCPSDRVRTGRFGACLMAEPQRVAECIAAMAAAVTVPVTVKTRTGIDHRDSYADLHHFVATVADSGCRTFIIHARKAWLQGLSPRQNRDIPPLNYDRVNRIKADFPNLEVIINGGIHTLEQALGLLSHVDGVMIGRAACNNPYMLANADALLFGDPRPAPSRQSVLDDFMHYAEAQLSHGVSLHSMTRHLLGLYQGKTGARAFRRHLSEKAVRPEAGIEVLAEASRLVNAA
jgi:tRNA-dihydrouridine synthase A